MKLLCAVLAFGWLSTFIWYHELDVRMMRQVQLERVLFKAQNEAFAVHADAINKLTDIVVRMAKDRD